MGRPPAPPPHRDRGDPTNARAPVGARHFSLLTLAEVEDLYRPYRPKRKTRASVAKEKGLEPLALYILAQASGCRPPLEEAVHYVDAEKGVDSAEAALAGAMDIIAESVSDDAQIRKELRTLIF